LPGKKSNQAVGDKKKDKKKSKEDKKNKKKKVCCESYKNGKRCKNCPLA